MQMTAMIPWVFCCRHESRQGRLLISQLGGPSASSPGLPHEQAQLSAMQPDTQSDMQPEQAANMHLGMPSLQSASSNSFSGVQTEQGAISSVVQQDGTQDGHAAGDSSSSMSLVEAAALAASSPGAVVHVPTSTALSQADQIALRYQHQVRQPAVHAAWSECFCCGCQFACPLCVMLKHSCPAPFPFPSPASILPSPPHHASEVYFSRHTIHSLHYHGTYHCCC